MLIIIPFSKCLCQILSDEIPLILPTNHFTFHDLNTNALSVNRLFVKNRLFGWVGWLVCAWGVGERSMRFKTKPQPILVT